MLRHSQSATQSTLRTMPRMFCGCKYLMSQSLRLKIMLSSWRVCQWPAPDPTLDFPPKHSARVKMNCTDHRLRSPCQDSYSPLFICQIWWWSTGPTFSPALIGYWGLKTGFWLVRTASSRAPGPIVLTSQFPALMGQKMIIKLASDQWSLEA